MEREGVSIMSDESREDVKVPEDLAAALQEDPRAEAIWDQLPEAHRRGHVIAIERIEDAEARAAHVRHTVEHLFQKHG
jgi:uncharacterized protein YdeI (YjbR/CyaY-like superfamily)